MEQWRAIPGYEHCYEVSDRGRVRRLAGYVKNSRGQGFRRIPARVLKPALIRGYPSVVLSQDGRPRGFRVHSLVLLAFIGPRPIGHDTNHKDGNKQHNALGNLEYVTEAYNNQHAYDVCGKRAKLAHGEANPMTRLTAAQVQEIRALRARGFPLSDLAGDFHVSVQTIANIAKRKTWGHIV